MDLIEKLMGNKTAHTLLEPKERKCFERVGKDNCIVLLCGEWTKSEQRRFDEDYTYRIKPDYRPVSRIKWLTKAEIVKAAKESDEAALACSIEHYQQMCDATEEEFREAYPGKVNINGENCALCQRYNSKGQGCETCLFQVNGRTNPLWWEVKDALEEWEKGKCPYSALHNVFHDVLTALQALQSPQVEKCEVSPTDLCYMRTKQFGFKQLHEALSDPDHIEFIDRDGKVMEIRGNLFHRNVPAPVPAFVVFARRPK